MKLSVGFLFVLIMLMMDCNNPTAKKGVGKNSHLVYKVDTLIRKKSSTTLKEVFVVNPDGISGYTTHGGKTDSVNLEYGSRLNVTKILDSWYRVSYRLENVYVRRSETVIETEISLTDTDLNVAYYNDTLDRPERFPNIEIRLVTKENFERMKATAVNYFEADTQQVKKINGKFSLRFGKRSETFADDKKGDYNYLGQFKSMNAYLIEAGSEEAEHADFIMLDKTTGKRKHSFPAMPFFSIDKQKSIAIDPSDAQMADVYIFTNNEQGNSNYAFGRYKNWLPVDTYNMFWGADGCFYLPVLPKMAYRNRWNNPMGYPESYNNSYIRIKVTGPDVR